MQPNAYMCTKCGRKKNDGAGPGCLECAKRITRVNASFDKAGRDIDSIKEGISLLKDDQSYPQAERGPQPD